MNKTNISDIQKKILEILSTATLKNGYVCSRYLLVPAAEVVGHFVSPVAIRNEIKLLRKMGYPIIADSRGYKWTNNVEELQNYCKARILELDDEYDTINSMLYHKVIKSIKQGELK